MDETLDVLENEGLVVAERFRWERRTCELCAEPAHYKCTFLYEGYRTNQASAAYGKDDCSWCEDDHAFACKAHKNDVYRHPPDGMVECSMFPASKQFAHMFLGKVKISPANAPAPAGDVGET